MAEFSTDKVYFVKQNLKITVTLNNRNMQLRVIETNRKSIITLMSKLQYLSDSRPLKGRHVHVPTELLKTEFGS